MILSIISKNYYTNRSPIIVESMDSNNIITTCLSLIDLPSLSYNIVIGNISPLLWERMCSINTTDYLLIRFWFIKIYSFMMNNNSRDLSYFFDWIYEWMPIFCILNTRELSCETKSFLNKSYPYVLELESIELNLSFWWLNILEIRWISIFPFWTIRIS